MRNRDDASMRRRLVVLLAPLLAVGVAFRRGYRPSWSFARAADYVVRKAPGERGAALRTLRDSLECDAYEVSLANRSIVLYNATLALDGSDALRLGRVAVFCDSWSPLVVSVEVANVSVLVLARDLLFLNTNWHRVAELEAALETLSPLSSSSSEAVVSGVRRLEFGGVAACELTGPAGTVRASLDWEHDLAPLSRRVAALAAADGSVSVAALFDMVKGDLALRAATAVLARALDDRNATSRSSITVAGVDVDVLRPKQAFRALADRAREYAGVDKDTSLVETAAMALLRRAVDDEKPGPGETT